MPSLAEVHGTYESAAAEGAEVGEVARRKLLMSKVVSSKSIAPVVTTARQNQNWRPGIQRRLRPANSLLSNQNLKTQ